MSRELAVLSGFGALSVYVGRIVVVLAVVIGCIGCRNCIVVALVVLFACVALIAFVVMCWSGGVN